MKTLRIALIGIPNTGKSSLIDSITGRFLGAISQKPQTTQELILGVKKREDLQLLFYDTPGISNARQESVKQVNRVALSALKFADVCVFLFAPDKKITDDIMEIARKTTKKVAVINKIDVRKKSLLLPMIEKIKDDFNNIYLISCRFNEGIADLLNGLFGFCSDFGSEEEEYLIPTNRSLQQLLNDVTRESIFNLMKEEVPYNVWVETVSMDEREKSVTIHQNIHIKPAYRHIFLSKIKELSMSARKRMEPIVGKKLHLFIQCVD